jgi:hypothetical protein
MDITRMSLFSLQKKERDLRKVTIFEVRRVEVMEKNENIR